MGLKELNLGTILTKTTESREEWQNAEQLQKTINEKDIVTEVQDMLNKITSRKI